MGRLLFEKTGNGVWISHLDLMRLFQRAFKRAGLPLTHTQGFNPRPSVSIALPLSVGIESCCELLDFDLDGAAVPNEELCRRLNSCLVDGIKILEVYDSGRKLRDLALMDCSIVLEYDNGIPNGAGEKLEQLFARPELSVPKRTKNGIQEQNIIPMIKSIACSRLSDCELELRVRLCCQNPTLNPTQIVAAIGLYCPELAPDFSRCCRLEIYDTNETVFR